MIRREEEQPYPDHPERFEYHPQVLCREGLCGRCYWEADWSGGRVSIAVTYKDISRRGEGYDYLLGHNNKSRGVFQVADFVNTLSCLTLKTGKLRGFRSRKRGNETFW